MRMRRGAAALALLAGCGTDPPAPVGSALLPSEEIALGVQLRSNGGLAQIFASLSRDQDVVTLIGGDELFFGEPGSAGERLSPFEGSYAGQLATGSADFELVLARAAGARFTSAIALPAPFAITAPAGPASRAAPIPLAWGPPGAPSSVMLEVDGACLASRIVRQLDPDPGVFDIQPADLFVDAGTGDCELLVTVTRTGLVDALAPELDAASVAHTLQIRAAAIPTVP